MSKKQEDIGLRPQLLHAMRGDQSHITFDEAVKDSRWRKPARNRR